MIISLSGWKGSGKDEAARILTNKYGFRRLAFADILKDMVARDYGISRESLDDPKLKEKPLLQYPVNPSDGFTKMLYTFMVKELRDANGNKAPECEYSKLPQLYHTPRSLAILMGSTNRFVQSNFWVQKALSSISKNENVIITDMRYNSEMSQITDFAKDSGHTLSFVRVNRFAISPSQDPSERDLDNAKFDFTLDNKGTLKEFEAKVLDWAKKYVF